MHLSPSPSPASIPSYFSSSSSPRSLLVWGVVVSSWLVPALLPVAAAQTPSEAVVVGVSTGINNVTGQRPARININDLYDEAGLHWDLYVQALDMFQRVDMTEIESYYQIAGIHGLPFLPWNGVNQTTGGANSGYCPHGQTTFISWHRPYLALFEQILAHHVSKAALQYPVETVDAYTAAAQTFRIPYWDWARDATLPPATTNPTASFNSPSGPATMRNPLRSFAFPNFPFHNGGSFGGSLAQFNETKRCTLVSGASAGVSDMDEATSVLTSDGAQLQDKVYAVFTQSTTFEAMATMSNAGASFEEPHNVVHDDISCFSVAGRSGHMGDLNWSGFDPIFMLHHANIDRLYAMWQAINYNDPVFTTSQHGNALFGTASGPETADSPLRPFFASSTSPSNDNAVFHTSRSVESIRSFGYTYPEINDRSLAPGDLADNVRVAVNNLYGPGADSSDSSANNKKRDMESPQSPDVKTKAATRPIWGFLTARRSRRVSGGHSGGRDALGSKKPHVTNGVSLGAAGAADGTVAGVLGTNDYSVEIGVDRAQLTLPCTIELHLVGFVSGHYHSSDANNSSSVHHHRHNANGKIGSTSILSMPQTGTSYSTTPLRRVLLAEASRSSSSAPPPLVFGDTAAVVAHLFDRLRVVIKAAGDDNTVVPVGSVPSLTMTVQQRSYTAVSADNEFPQYGPVTQYPVTPQDLSV